MGFHIALHSWLFAWFTHKEAWKGSVLAFPPVHLFVPPVFSDMNTYKSTRKRMRIQLWIFSCSATLSFSPACCCTLVSFATCLRALLKELQKSLKVPGESWFRCSFEVVAWIFFISHSFLVFSQDSNNNGRFGQHVARVWMTRTPSGIHERLSRWLCRHFQWQKYIKRNTTVPQTRKYTHNRLVGETDHWVFWGCRPTRALGDAVRASGRCHCPCPAEVSLVRCQTSRHPRPAASSGRSAPPAPAGACAPSSPSWGAWWARVCRAARAPAASRCSPGARAPASAPPSTRLQRQTHQTCQSSAEDSVPNFKNTHPKFALSGRLQGLQRSSVPPRRARCEFFRMNFQKRNCTETLCCSHVTGTAKNQSSQCEIVYNFSFLNEMYYQSPLSNFLTSGFYFLQIGDYAGLENCGSDEHVFFNW